MSLAVVYSRELNGEVLTLSASGWTYYFTFVLFDYETESMWYPVDIGSETDTSCGCLATVSHLLCIAGELAGETLPMLPSHNTRWDEWYVDHPNSWIMREPD